MEVTISGNHAFLPGAGALVTFTQPSYAAFSAIAGSSAEGKSEPLMKKLITRLDIAPWGEDNRFPQNITGLIDYCGVIKSALDWKARAIWGNGIMWGKITGYQDDGTEIFKPAQPGEYPDVEQFMEDNGNLYRFYLEFLQDWCHFSNCFPELVMSKNGKLIKRLVHQESCDCRFQQMDDEGRIQWVILSKLWGQLKDQFVKFDAKKAVATAVAGGSGTAAPTEIDNEYVKRRRALDPYDAVADLKAAVKEKHRNIIYPVQYPSTNKTYYQLAAWDGARQAGWVEIAAKIPAMLKAMYNNAFNIKYHIKIPENYMERRYDGWSEMQPGEREQKRKATLREMNDWLSGAENAYKTFVSYFQIRSDGKEDLGKIEIEVVDNKSTIDKDLIASSAANSEILFSLGINPDLIGAGTPGGNYSGSAGSGSNIREAYLVYTSLLHLERQIVLEPLRLVQRYNGWDPKLTWRFRDVVLTTLDKNTGTEKKVS